MYCLNCVTVGHDDGKQPSLTTGTSGRKVCVRVPCFGASRPLQQQVGHQVCGFKIKLHISHEPIIGLLIIIPVVYLSLMKDTNFLGRHG